MRLPESQGAVLQAASPTDALTVEHLAAETDHPEPTVTGAVFALEEEGLVAVDTEEHDVITLTDEGRSYLADGLPEVRLYRAAVAAGADDAPVDLAAVLDATDMAEAAVQIALSNYARKGYGVVDGGEITADPDADPDADPEARLLRAIAAAEDNPDAGADPTADGTGHDDADTTGAAGAATVDSASVSDADDIDVDVDTGVLDRLTSRGLVDRTTETRRLVTVTDEGVTALMEGIEVADTVTELTPDLLTTGDWREVEFEEYNVAAAAEPTYGGRVHPLRRMAEQVKEVLVGMGFKEMDGPHADAEFWVNDCLFMPQDHPARTHWDGFSLDVPPMADLPADLVERVERAHREGVGSEGEGYHSPWAEDVARSVVLRGHTTSLSARYLSGLAVGDLDPPQRFFSVEKAYRNDELDATHLLEFFQIEGWVMAEDLSVRDMMGTFTELYAQFGITDLQFKPTYNPYTEPSFELFGEHPVTGEVVEIGNSGIFREEMLDPLGVEVDVMAWGLALERLLMLVTGAADIRQVHGTLVDLDYLRTEEVTY